MSITTAMYSGVSGLLANAEGINVIGNNLANVNTVGFKSGRILFSDMLSADLGKNSQIGRGVQIQKIDNIYAQGAFENTEVVSDLALQGNSFFALAKPTQDDTAAVGTQDAAYLTRAGAFRVNNNYNLVNPDGYKALQAFDGKTVLFPYVNGATAGDFAKITDIDTQGVIKYIDFAGDAYYYSGNGNPVLVANQTNYDAVKTGGFTIAVIAPTNPLGLNKIGGTLFSCTPECGVPAHPIVIATNQANSGDSEKMYSNSLEQSNVDMAAQFVKMILTQRAYSANSKTITTADEMTQEVLNLKR